KGATARHLDAVRELMSEEGVDVLVVTSSDRYLNEYTPRVDNHRYFLSGFTGSTALMLVPKDERARLYVDGRYHLQADQEVDSELVQVVKVPFGKTITASLLGDLAGRGVAGCEGERLSQRFRELLASAAAELRVLKPGAVDEALGRQPAVAEKPIELIPPQISGRTPLEKLDAVFELVAQPETTLLVVPALDDIAWLSDARGYHFLYQSSFAATGLARPTSFDVLVDEVVARHGLPDQMGVAFHIESLEDLIRSAAFDDVRAFQYDPVQTTAAVLESIQRARPAWKPRPLASPVVAVKSVKTPEELAHFESMNRRSSSAVARTIRWVRERIAQGRGPSEIEFYEAANGFYSDEGARDLSFHTISAIGTNTAIIHFGHPSDRVVAGPNDMMLLDSGALYEGGLATDITRTFLAGGKAGRASKEQREIYTLVLRGALAAQSAIFPVGTPGSFLDAMARAPIYARGRDYAHGTGHGVGVHVHEPGVGLSPTSQLGMRAGQVSSIEPGIYIEGFGGVRIENVVVFEDHPDHPGFLRCRPLVWVALDEHLFDDALLDDRERALIASYQATCAAQGNADLG
ncbi:MAG: M24 family metallopeptidase, partial [Planctomycetes bacterium]|nr:M24 family metallopeptidase [Planctomycetota bacterium]